MPAVVKFGGGPRNIGKMSALSAENILVIRNFSLDVNLKAFIV